MASSILPETLLKSRSGYPQKSGRHTWRRYGKRSISHFLFPISYLLIPISFLLASPIAPSAASPVFPFAPDPAACLQEPVSFETASNILATPTVAATPLNRLPEGSPVSDIVAIESSR